MNDTVDDVLLTCQAKVSWGVLSKDLMGDRSQLGLEGKVSDVDQRLFSHLRLAKWASILH